MAHRPRVVSSPARVAARYLQRDQTDSVADITFSLDVGTQTWVHSNHPRLGNVGFLKLEAIRDFHNVGEIVDLGPKDSWKPYPDDMVEPPDVMDDLYGTRLVETYWSLKSFRQDLRRPDLDVWGVANTWVDRRFRAESVGERMYLIAAAAAARSGCVITPNDTYGGGSSTSGDAKRVWAKLKGILPSHGDLVWGGGLNLSLLLSQPLKPRRGRGFGRTRPMNLPDDQDW